jgi:hypothetical protein
MPGGLYLQITQAPITTYADFLNFFHSGHTIDDSVDAPAIASTLAAAMLKIGVASRHFTKLKNLAIPDETFADISWTKSGSQLIQTTLDQALCELAIAEARKSIAEDDGKPHPGSCHRQTIVFHRPTLSDISSARTHRPNHADEPLNEILRFHKRANPTLPAA